MAWETGGGCETNHKLDAKKSNNRLGSRADGWINENVSGCRLIIIQGCQKPVPAMWF